MKRTIAFLLLMCSLSMATVTITTVKTDELDADGSTDEFSFSFPYAATSEVSVDVWTDAGDVASRQVETTNYSVSPSSSTSGGTVTFVTAPADGNYVVISRTTSVTQDADIDAGAYTSRTAIENAFDEVYRILNEHDDAITRSIRVPQGEVGTDMVLAGALARAGGYLILSATGALTTGTAFLPTTAAVSTFMETVLDDTTAVAAQSTLGLLNSTANLDINTLMVAGTATIDSFNGLVTSSPWIDVTHPDYGADPTGVADSTTAIQAALDDGGTIYFPSGTYKITKTLQIGGFTANGDNAANQDTFSLGGLDINWGDKTSFTLVESTKLIGAGAAFGSSYDIIGASSKILFTGTEAGPIILCIGVRDFLIQDLLLDGDAQKANEGIFFAGHCIGIRITDTTVVDCQIGARFGDNFEWTTDQATTHDPVDYKDDYDDAAIVAAGGWQVEHVDLENFTTNECTIGVSSETAQMVHAESTNGQWDCRGGALDTGLFLKDGGWVLNSFFVSDAKYGIRAAYSGTHNLRIYKGRCEDMVADAWAIKYGLDADLLVDGWLAGGDNDFDIDGGAVTLNQNITFRNCSFTGEVQIGGPANSAVNRLHAHFDNCKFVNILSFDTQQDRIHATISNCDFLSSTNATPIRSLDDLASVFLTGNSFATDADKEIEDLSGQTFGSTPFITLTDSDVTPSLLLGSRFLTNTTGITITRFDDVVAGQQFTIISKGAIVFDTSSASRLIGSSVDITTASGDVTTWLCETGGTTASVCRLLNWVDVSQDNSSTVEGIYGN